MGNGQNRGWVIIQMIKSRILDEFIVPDSVYELSVDLMIGSIIDLMDFDSFIM